MCQQAWRFLGYIIAASNFKHQSQKARRGAGDSHAHLCHGPIFSKTNAADVKYCSDEDPFSAGVYLGLQMEKAALLGMLQNTIIFC